MSAEEQYPRLLGLLADWLHEGWPDEGHATPLDAVRAFAEGTSRLAMRGVIAEIHQLLARKLPETALRRIVCEELGCDYDPTADGLTFPEWLLSVAEVLREKSGK